jgi:OOP family OmpA-OmpF porin
MNKMKTALFLAALAFAPGALAEGGSFYVGGSIGKGTAKTACSSAVFECDNKDQTWALSAGVMFNANWGLEGGYRNLGRIATQLDPAGSGANAEVKSRVGEIVGVGAFPIQKFAIFGKFGVYRAKTDLTSNFATEGSSRNNNFTFGVGVSYDVLRHLSLRLETQRYNNLGGADVGFRTDVDTLSLGAFLKF